MPIKSLPALPNGNYFLVAQTTDAFAQGTSLASTAATTTIAAPFITLAATLGAVAKIQSGDTLTLTNNGNINDKSTFHFTLGFSSTTSYRDRRPYLPTKPNPRTLKTHVPARIHFNDWSKILTGLVPTTCPLLPHPHHHRHHRPHHHCHQPATASYPKKSNLRTPTNKPFPCFNPTHQRADRQLIRIGVD